MSNEEELAASKEDHAGDPNDTPQQKRVVRRVGEEEKLPLTIHLEELRWRLVYSASTVFIVFFALYAMSGLLFDILSKPMGEYQLYAIAPTEIFFAYLKISFYGAVIVSMPMLLFHAWEFVAPGLFESERKNTGWFVLFGTLFFAIGASFCYFMVLPYGLEFLLSYGGDVQAQITIGNYLGFLFKLVIAFGLVFEMPLVIIFLTQMGVVTPDILRKQRSYFIVGSFVLAAILTPPDVFTQIIMGLPMILLFEVSILVSNFFVKKKDVDE